MHATKTVMSRPPIISPAGFLGIERRTAGGAKLMLVLVRDGRQ